MGSQAQKGKEFPGGGQVRKRKKSVGRQVLGGDVCQRRKLGQRNLEFLRPCEGSGRKPVKRPTCDRQWGFKTAEGGLRKHLVLTFSCNKGIPRACGLY